MSSQLVHGFVVFIDETFVAAENSFDDAVSIAMKKITGVPSTAALQICSANTRVSAGGGVLPQQIWNYDRTINKWVEVQR